MLVALCNMIMIELKKSVGEMEKYSSAPEIVLSDKTWPFDVAAAADWTAHLIRNK